MNIVVKDSPWTASDLNTLFETEDIIFTEAKCMSNLMVELGVFPSTSKARAAGRFGAIPSGYTEFKASKKKRIWIWNPSD